MATVFHTSLLAPLAIARLNELWDMAIGGGMSNPMTAPGDLVVGGEVIDGVPLPARLAKGAEGQVLKIVGGALAWTTSMPPPIPIACGDETTPIVVKEKVVNFHWPVSGTVVGVWAGVDAVQVSGDKLMVDLKNAGVSMLSIKLTIDNGQVNSLNAAVQPVISGATVVKGGRASIDVTQVGNGTATGLKLYVTVVPS